MTSSNIVGTFVDGNGTSGTWTAVRVPEGP
jgi:hypothetical protein